MLRSKSDAPTSRTSASASWAARRIRRRVAARRPEVARPGASRRASESTDPEAENAGRRPASAAAASPAASAKRRERASTEISALRGRAAPPSRTRAAVSQTAPSVPRAPPESASTTVSARKCRTMRPRDAPMAVRIATSRRRARPRASSRFATFTQASNRTNATATTSSRSGFRELPEMASASGTISSLQPVFFSG